MWNSSQKTYPANTLANFTIQLAQPIDLGLQTIGRWGNANLAILHLIPTQKQPYELAGETNALIYCDLITQQFVGSDYVRCLRTFIHPTKYCDHAFQNVYYIPVEKRTFYDISTLITDLNCKKSLS